MINIIKQDMDIVLLEPSRQYRIWFTVCFAIISLFSVFVMYRASLNVGDFVSLFVGLIIFVFGVYFTNIVIINKIIEFYPDKGKKGISSMKSFFEILMICFRSRILRIVNILFLLPFISTLIFLTVYDMTGWYWSVTEHLYKSGDFKTIWSAPNDNVQQEIFEIANTIYIMTHYYFAYFIRPLSLIFFILLTYWTYKELKNKNYSMADMNNLLLLESFYQKGFKPIHIILLTLLIVLAGIFIPYYMLDNVEKIKVLYTFLYIDIYGGIYNVLKIFTIYMLGIFCVLYINNLYTALKIYYFSKNLNVKG